MSIPLEKSFASHEKSIFWSDKNEKHPKDVSKCSGSKYWFNCSECGHEFEGSLNHISTGCWCSYCSNKKLCNNNECKKCFKKSFASHEKSIFWSDKNEKQPIEVLRGSGKTYLFNCECGHEPEISLNNITNMNSWCGYCSNPPKHLCDNENCKMCFEKSFASHEKSIFWSDKNKIQPRNAFMYSDDKYWFVCNNGHSFEAILCNISNCRWCSKCHNKTETKLYEHIIQIYPSIIMQFKQEWCKNIYYLPFDFCIPEIQIIIELDGNQHFKQVMNWKSPEENFETDKYKEKCANENGYSTIRVIQEDVWNDIYDWCKELCETIENIKNGNSVVNIYLCKKNEYVKYK